MICHSFSELRFFLKVGFTVVTSSSTAGASSAVIFEQSVVQKLSLPLDSNSIGFAVVVDQTSVVTAVVDTPRPTKQPFPMPNAQPTKRPVLNPTKQPIARPTLGPSMPKENAQTSSTGVSAASSVRKQENKPCDACRCLMCDWFVFTPGYPRKRRLRIYRVCIPWLLSLSPDEGFFEHRRRTQ